MKITKRQLKRIIKEERRKLLSEQGHEMYAKDDELREIGDGLSEMIAVTSQTEMLMNDMTHRYGELVVLGTDMRTILHTTRELAKKYQSKLDDIKRFR